MPALETTQLLQRLDGAHADAFIAQPDWQGVPLESGPLARNQDQPLIATLCARHGRGLLPRLIARLVEITELMTRLAHPDQLDSNACSEQGLAQLEAARGRLFHRVLLDGERIGRYRILAPTEWNFGPQGPAAQALAGLRDGPAEIVELQARLMIHAIDPCVGYELELEAA